MPNNYSTQMVTRRQALTGPGSPDAFECPPDTVQIAIAAEGGFILIRENETAQGYKLPAGTGISWQDRNLGKRTIYCEGESGATNISIMYLKGLLA